MKHYLLSVIDGSPDTHIDSGTEDTDIDRFNSRLQATKQLLYANGLASPDRSTVIDNRGGRGVQVPGPLVSGAEYVAGFWIVAAPDHDAALALAAEGSKACNRKVELRPFHDG
ncbi:MAG: YciI family protein [Gemmatimonadaceae bacterium]